MSNNIDHDWSEDDSNQSLLSAVLDAEDIDIMDDPSLHHLDLQIDVPFENYNSDEEPLAVVQRTLLNSMKESSRNAAITEAKLRLTTLLASNGLHIWPLSADGDC
ncbi:hypothetical protein RRG08_036521 [Elysia crispata]|uniref:Uncharacterized protein n=1 Tax=Elysia crispata TaxID=231223 RepID=A0AAE1CEF5_9GAST|nr:hypothetical protein RRG08_021627 [Elysia crispata]KAK3758249.1 hypothetical protein RRG08_036521 [Elysia crispata]